MDHRGGSEWNIASVHQLSSDSYHYTATEQLQRTRIY